MSFLSGLFVAVHIQLPSFLKFAGKMLHQWCFYTLRYRRCQLQFTNSLQWCRTDRLKDALPFLLRKMAAQKPKKQHSSTEWLF